jgi:hypothetical protein
MAMSYLAEKADNAFSQSRSLDPQGANRVKTMNTKTKEDQNGASCRKIKK